MTETNSEDEKQHSPSLSATTVNIAALPGLLAGFSRTFITKSVLLGLSLIREGIQWWFRVPIKMFRPYAVNPWMVLNEMAAHDGQQFTYRYIQQAVKKEGWRILGLNVFPLMVANGMVGAVLFHSYTISSSLFKDSQRYYIAGGIAGLMSSVISTPMDRVTRMIVKGESIKYRHHGVHHAAHFALRSVPGDLITRLKYLYSGFAFNSIKDSLGFCMFFGVFESMQRFGKRWTSKHWNYPITDAKIRPDRTRSLAIADGVVVILSGAVGGACYQTVTYPLLKLQSEAERLHLRYPKPPFELGLALIKRRGLFHYYRGVQSQLIRAMPPSAIGLFVYEISSEWIAKFDQFTG